jgi:hypothetical protein
MHRDAIEHSCYLAILMGLGHGRTKVRSRRRSPCASGLSNSKANYQSATQTVAQSASVTIVHTAIGALFVLGRKIPPHRDFTCV